MVFEDHKAAQGSCKVRARFAQGRVALVAGGPAAGGAFWGLILGPDPNGMDFKIGPKTGPGIILIKPEALLRDME